MVPQFLPQPAIPSALPLIVRCTDRVPPDAPPAETLRKICAYCPDFNPRLPENKGATHVICATCCARLEAELAAAQAKRQTLAGW